MPLRLFDYTVEVSNRYQITICAPSPGQIPPLQAVMNMLGTKQVEEGLWKGVSYKLIKVEERGVGESC